MSVPIAGAVEVPMSVPMAPMSVPIAVVVAGSVVVLAEVVSSIVVSSFLPQPGANKSNNGKTISIRMETAGLEERK